VQCAISRKREEMGLTGIPGTVEEIRKENVWQGPQVTGEGWIDLQTPAASLECRHGLPVVLYPTKKMHQPLRKNGVIPGFSGRGATL
jgi:hypothetical protein